MPTQFTKIMKIKKNVVKQIENLIQKIHFDIHVNAEDKAKNIQNLHTLDVPKQGDFQLILTLQAQKESILSHIQRLDGEKSVLEELLKTQQSRHKIAQLDLEKMIYLENKALTDILQQAKRKEQIDMDEIANILYTNNKKKS